MALKDGNKSKPSTANGPVKGGANSSRGGHTGSTGGVR